MKIYRKLHIEIFPKFTREFFNYRTYVENLSEFTTYANFNHIRCFFRYVLCTKRYKDLSKFYELNDFNSVTLNMLKHFTLNDMLNYMQFLTTELHFEDRTKATYIGTIKTFYHYLYKKLKYFKEDYFEDLAIPKYREKSVVCLSPDECSKLIDTLNNCDNPRNKALVFLILYTGCRRCEVANALYSNLNLDTKTLLIVGKGDKERYLFLNDFMINILKDYLKVRKTSTDYLFVSFHGNKLSYNDIWRTVRKYLLLAGLDVKKYSTHKLRHTFATNVYRECKDIRVVQELLGHSRLDTTKIYTHIENSTLHNVVDNFSYEKIS